MSRTSTTSAPPVAAARAARDARGGKYLTFVLGAEEYGIEVGKVRGIIRYTDVTPVPRTPAYMSGVINLRGQVLPVIDLRIKLGLQPAARSERTCIIIVETRDTEAIAPGDGERKVQVGLVVDRVLEVPEVPAQTIDKAPPLGRGVQAEFILGLAKAGGGLKILLDIDRVLGSEP
jgi:purine-binding chemotaxis protein CheW